MAQQAILAQQRRRHAQAAEANGFMTTQKGVNPRLTIIQALEENKDRLYELFDLWDEDRDGRLDEREFRRGLKQLGIKPTLAAYHNFLEETDYDQTGEVTLEKIERLLKLKAKELTAPEVRAWSDFTFLSVVSTIKEVLNGDGIQTLLYLTLVIIFQVRALTCTWVWS